MKKIGMTAIMMCFWTGMGLLALGPMPPGAEASIDLQNHNDGRPITLMITVGESYDDRDRFESRDGPTSYDLDQQDGFVNKRSAFGLFGLATKRPHKSEADLTHPPHPNAFTSLRGRKRSSLYSRGQLFSRLNNLNSNSAPVHFPPWSLYPSSFSDPSNY